MMSKAYRNCPCYDCPSKISSINPNRNFVYPLEPGKVRWNKVDGISQSERSSRCGLLDQRPGQGPGSKALIPTDILQD